MEEILNEYYEDNARKLRLMVDKILGRFGGLSDKDKDDFYSLANEVFTEVLKKYDDTQTFSSYLYSCLSNRIKTEMTTRNREKRRADRISISIDAPAGEEDETVGDLIAGSFSVEREVFAGREEWYSRRMMTYLDRLSKLQREVLMLHSDGYLPGEIRERLQITEKQYADCHSAIHAYRNISILL